jgi:hypothetical protein
MATFDVFSQARKLNMEVLLWGKTRNPMIQVVLVRPKPDSRRASRPYIAWCFDLSNGGLFSPENRTSFAAGQAAFLDKVNNPGHCPE